MICLGKNREEGSDLVVTVVDAPDEGILIAWTPTGLVDVLVHDVVEVDERVTVTPGMSMSLWSSPARQSGATRRGELLGFVVNLFIMGMMPQVRLCRVTDACHRGS